MKFPTAKTWKVELAFVALVLAVTLAVTGRITNYIELTGAVAVLLTFAHAQVADRLAAAAAAEEDRVVSSRSVYCHRWARRYWVSKEIVWLAYFTAIGAYSALVGVGVFLAYPVWREFWWQRKPLATEADIGRARCHCGAWATEEIEIDEGAEIIDVCDAHVPPGQLVFDQEI